MDVQGRELYSVSPVANVYAALQGVRQLLVRHAEFSALEAFNRRYGTAKSPTIGNQPADNLVQESGKPDLMACLLDKDGRTIALSIEVKSFVKKFSLDDTLWRDNQKDWMHKTTFGYGYWIFLWGIPSEIPHTGLRSKALKQSIKAWLIPGLIWERKAELYYQSTKQYTVHMSLAGVRVKKALRDAGMTVDDIFSTYELYYERDVWWPNLTHPLIYMLEHGEPLGPACLVAGEKDAKYAFPPPAKAIAFEVIDEATDRENGRKVSQTVK
jgi:hypothetical protein